MPIDDALYIYWRADALTQRTMCYVCYRRSAKIGVKMTHHACRRRSSPTVIYLLV